MDMDSLDVVAQLDCALAQRGSRMRGRMVQFHVP
jgi:hypothetical protein